MKDNIDEIDKFREHIRKCYPRASHTIDLAFPLGNAGGCAFSVEQLPYIMQKLPFLFDFYEHNSETAKVKFRCSGGVAQCTLMPDGKLKICNTACDDCFCFKNNAYKTGIKYAWQHCGVNVSSYRREMQCDTIDCKKCSSRDQCITKDCRVLAWVYCGDRHRSNPLTCYTTKQQVKV